MFSARHPTAIGDLVVTVDDAGALLRIDLPTADAQTESARSDRARCSPVLRQLDEYFAGRRTAFDLPLVLFGTPFQRAAWGALCTIPFGRTVSYQEQALRLGRPTAVRAVGAANGANPIPIVVPCHRVIGKNGALVGFGGGLGTKRFLLDHEARVLAAQRPH